LLDAVQDLEITWVTLAEGNPLSGRTLAEANLRAQTGASVVAVRQGGELVPNPSSEIRIRAGDQLALIGESAQVSAAESLLARDA
jgi:CPA2 family monovalent cation:H+ antiporter-2